MKINLNFKKKKTSKKALKEYMEAMAQNLQPNDLVLVNYEKIVNSSDYENYSQQYKDFLEYVNGKVCVVTYENKKREKAGLVSLYVDKDENTINSWLFHKSDLIKLSKEQVMELANKN